MRRVFYLITELDVGGAEKTLYELATRLNRKRYEPIVACLTGRGPVGDWLRKAEIDVIHIDMRSWYDIPAWLRLRKALREFRPHIVHSFLFHANLAGRLATMGLGIERTISAVRVEEPRRAHLWGERLTRGLADTITCVSESARQYTHERAHVPLSKLVVIPNGLDPDRYFMPLVRPPSKWELPEDGPMVGVIGRLSEQKRPLLMLQAAQKVIGHLPDTVFAFAGDGELSERCRAEAQKLGIAKQIRWLGWIEDTRPLLARMDLLALSSAWEGMPNVVLEAMACAKPVIATAVGGCRDLISDGETGHLVPPEDATFLAEKIVALLTDKEKAERLGHAARERIKAYYLVGNMVSANESLYE